jgi:hypothetical protein
MPEGFPDEITVASLLEQKKELFASMVEKLDVDRVGKIARAYTRKFPAPSCLGTGNL